MKEEVIYWAVFESGESKHDRVFRLTGYIELPSFFEWLKEQKKEIEDKTGRSVTIVNCGKIV